MDTIRTTVVGQTVRGGIDWGRTIRARSSSGGLPTLFATRPAHRVFNTPENRALVWLLKQLDSELRRIPSAQQNPQVGIHNTAWMHDIEEFRNQLASAQRAYRLRDVAPERPSPSTRKRLAASRSAFYRETLANAINAVEKIIDCPGPEQLAETLCDRYFVPERDWKLFEIVVAVRLAHRLGELASSRLDRLLTGMRRSPYARYRIGTGEVRLWYQSWPRDSGPSSLQATANRYQLRADPTRPDIVIEVCTREQRQAILLEAKASRRSNYLGQGVVQALGYLRDRPGLFTSPPFAAVVCPRSDAFSPTENHTGLDVAVVSADDVADWVASRVSSALAA
jgi:hypothetical protein